MPNHSGPVGASTKMSVEQMPSKGATPTLWKYGRNFPKKISPLPERGLPTCRAFGNIPISQGRCSARHVLQCDVRSIEFYAVRFDAPTGIRADISQTSGGPSGGMSPREERSKCSGKRAEVAESRPIGWRPSSLAQTSRNSQTSMKQTCRVIASSVTFICRFTSICGPALVSPQWLCVCRAAGGIEIIEVSRSGRTDWNVA